MTLLGDRTSATSFGARSAADIRAASRIGRRVQDDLRSGYYLVVAEAGLFAASVALLVGTVALLVWRVRNPTWVRDAQLSQNASPLISLLMLALGALLVALVSAVGIFWVAAGHNIVGWGMICVAATGLAHVWVNVWIRRQPFP